MATTSHTTKGSADQNSDLTRAGKALRFLRSYPDRELTVEEALRLVTVLTRAGFENCNVLHAGPWDAGFRLVLLNDADSWITTSCYLYRKGAGVYNVRVNVLKTTEHPDAP